MGNQFIELLAAVASRIHVNEKDIPRFSVNREVNPKTRELTDTLVLIETYVSKQRLRDSGRKGMLTR
jgi:hypothetical protein